MFDSILREFKYATWLWASNNDTLLNYVLSGDIAGVNAICQVSPKRLFLMAKATSSAAGIDGLGYTYHRTLEMNPYRVALAEGHFVLLNEILKFSDIRIDQQKTGYEYMAEFFDRQFPNGVEYPTYDYDFMPLIQAITDDPSLSRFATMKSLKNFMRDHLPQCGETTGHHSPLHAMKKACQLAIANWNRWNERQRLFYYIKVIGYFQRLLSQTDAEMLCGGFAEMDKKLFSSDRSLKLINFKTEDELQYFPLDQNPEFKLGVDFAISVYPHSAAIETDKNPATHAQLSDLMKSIIKPAQCDSAKELAMAIFNLDIALDKLIHYKIDFLKKFRIHCDTSVARRRLMRNLTDHFNQLDYKKARKIYSISPDFLFERKHIQLVFKELHGYQSAYALKILLDVFEIYSDNRMVIKQLLREELSYQISNRIRNCFELINLVEHEKIEFYEKSTAIKKVIQMVRDPEITDETLTDCIEAQSLNPRPKPLAISSQELERLNAIERRHDLWLSRH